MSGSESAQASSLPGRTIHGAYRSCLQARSDYQRAIGGPMESAAHEQLHDAVANYYQALRPLISSANVTETLWEEEQLWPTRPLFANGGACPNCGIQERAEGFEEAGISINEDLCPNCGSAVIESTTVPMTDENGQQLYDWVRGLEALTGIWDRVEEVQVSYTNALGPYSTTKREAVLLEPSKLLTVARKLDEALEKLNLHAEVDDEVGTTELDNEDLQDYAEQIEKIREQFADEESLADKEVADE